MILLALIGLFISFKIPLSLVDQGVLCQSHELKRLYSKQSPQPEKVHRVVLKWSTWVLFVKEEKNAKQLQRKACEEVRVGSRTSASSSLWKPKATTK